jgi:cytoskeletal protein CcmA (bactofilin family)
MPITPIITTNTFRDWFNKTNEIIAKMNAGTLVDGVVANGAFTVNGSLLVVNTFSANSTKVDLRGNTTFTANVTATSNCNVWNFACGTLIIQPLNGTMVNTDITINGAATFLQAVNFSANVNITADQSVVTGNLIITGTSTANGPLIAQHIAFAAAGALVVPGNLTNPQYDDYQPVGGDVAAVWNLTPTIDTVLTGIAAPTEFVTGSQVLYIQNMSDTYQISLASANVSSQVHNRFKTPSDAVTNILPGGIVELVYSSTNHQWRVISSGASVFPSLNVTGNTVMSGTLNVAGNTTFTGQWVNIAGTLQVTGNTQLGNTQVNGWLNVSSFLVIAGNSTLTGNVTASATFVSNGNAAFNANTTLAANTSVTAKVTLSGAGRLVLPVGSNLWAT